MGLFNAYKSLAKANEILKRIENCIDLLEDNINSGNFSQARTYCNEAASRVREFLEVCGGSKTAEISVYTFKGQKFRVMQLAMLFNEALLNANFIIKQYGY